MDGSTWEVPSLVSMTMLAQPVGSERSLVPCPLLWPKNDEWRPCVEHAVAAGDVPWLCVLPPAESTGSAEAWLSNVQAMFEDVCIAVWCITISW